MLAPLFKHALFLLGLGGLLIVTAVQPGAAQQLSARSGPHTVALLELYTSEGCNSCPPADEWVRALAGKGLTLDRVVPLGLHVDYWDDLGWPDRFAQAIFTRRQREVAARHRSRSIYTPQLVLHGQSLTQWHTINAEVQRINQIKARADLSLEVSQPTPGSLEVVAHGVVPETAARAQTRMYVALYERRLTSAVSAGENKGRTLQHDYVVRQWIGPLNIDEQGAVRLQRTLPLHSDWKTPDLGLVAFVQQQQTGDVLQTVVLPLEQ